MKNQMRAIRRHHRRRIQRNLLRDNYVCRNWIEPIPHSNNLKEHLQWLDDHNKNTTWIRRVLGIMVNTRPLCSCCSNPRKWEGKSIQELKNEDRAHDQIED